MASRLFLRIILFRIIPEVHFQQGILYTGIFHCLTFANFYNKHYFFHSRAKIFGKVHNFRNVREKKNTYLHLFTTEYF